MSDATTNGAAGKVRIIGFICERAYDLEKIMNADGTFISDPDVRLIPLPCSGMVQPGFIEKALEAGAQGSFVMGCMLGDCYFRDGNYVIKERIERVRRPQIKRKYNLEQIGTIWFSRAMMLEELEGLIAQFKHRALSFCQEHPELMPAAKAKHEAELRKARTAPKPAAAAS
ncbi:MAG: hydrogenase iron-sulfur subunit [bacterium]